MYNAWAQERRKAAAIAAQVQRENAGVLYSAWFQGKGTTMQRIQQNGTASTEDQETENLQALVQQNVSMFNLPQSAEELTEQMAWSQQVADREGLFPRSVSRLYNAQLYGVPFKFASTVVYRTKPAHTNKDGVEFKEAMVANVMVSVIDTDTMTLSEPMLAELQGGWLIPQLRDFTENDLAAYVYTVDKDATKPNNPWSIRYWADVPDGVHQTTKTDKKSLQAKTQALGKINPATAAPAPAKRPGSTVLGSRVASSAPHPAPVLRRADTGAIVDSEPPTKRKPGRPRKAEA